MSASDGPASDRPLDRASERRSLVRTGVVWDALRQALAAPGAYADQQARIVDLGGGTGGFAVPLAELGHRVLVVDPSPDALAALGRRAAERGVTDLVTGVQGDVAELPALAADTVGGAHAGAFVRFVEFCQTLCQLVFELQQLGFGFGQGILVVAGIAHQFSLSSVRSFWRPTYSQSVKS